LAILNFIKIFVSDLELFILFLVLKNKECYTICVDVTQAFVNDKKKVYFII